MEKLSQPSTSNANHVIIQVVGQLQNGDALPAPSPVHQNKSRSSSVHYYQCGQCEKAFLYKSKLLLHQVTHSGERPYKCPNCEKTYKRESELVVHQRVHTGERPFRCLKCDKAFKTKSELVVHDRFHKKWSWMKSNSEARPSTVFLFYYTSIFTVLQPLGSGMKIKVNELPDWDWAWSDGTKAAIWGSRKGYLCEYFYLFILFLFCRHTAHM